MEPRINGILKKTKRNSNSAAINSAFKRIPALAGLALPDVVKENPKEYLPILVTPAGLARGMKELLEEFSLSPLKLHECQEIVSRYLGFDRWSDFVGYWKKTRESC